MSDQPKTERGDRLAIGGWRAGDGEWCPLFVTREVDGSWTVTGPVPLGVRVAEGDIVALAEAILERVR